MAALRHKAAAGCGEWTLLVLFAGEVRRSAVWPYQTKGAACHRHPSFPPLPCLLLTPRRCTVAHVRLPSAPHTGAIRAAAVAVSQRLERRSAGQHTALPTHADAMSGEAHTSSPEKENLALELRAVTAEAELRVTKAEAEAKVLVTKAEAEAKVRVTKAEAEAKVRVAEAEAELRVVKAESELQLERVVHKARRGNPLPGFFALRVPDYDAAGSHLRSWRLRAATTPQSTLRCWRCRRCATCAAQSVRAGSQWSRLTVCN